MKTNWKDDPEYLALNRNGKRLVDHAMEHGSLPLSHNDLEWAKKASYDYLISIGVSPDDIHINREIT